MADGEGMDGELQPPVNGGVEELGVSSNSDVIMEGEEPIVSER